eukprot:gene36768-15362_t
MIGLWLLYAAPGSDPRALSSNTGAMQLDARGRDGPQQLQAGEAHAEERRE